MLAKNDRAMTEDPLPPSPFARIVSYQSCAWKSISAEYTIAQILADIKGEKYGSQISYLRKLLAQGDVDGYSAAKKRLPCVTFCGSFRESRTLESLIHYNHLIVFDIDHLDVENVSRATQKLISDKYVLAMWTSPSGQGVKGLVRIEYDHQPSAQTLPALHGAAFDALSVHFRNAHDLTIDPSGRDITRLCFLSSDPLLYQTGESDTLLVRHLQPIANDHDPQSIPHIRPSLAKVARTGNALKICHGKNRPEARRRMASIIKFLTKRQLSITESYDQWVRVGMAIANTFSHNIGEGYFIRLCQLDGDRHDPEASKQLLVSCYFGTRGNISFGTIVHFAQKMGYRNLGVVGSTVEKPSREGI